MIIHYSSAQKKTLLPARRFAAGGEERGPALAPPVSAESLAPPRPAGWGPEDGRVEDDPVVQNHRLHPDQLGGGRKMVELRAIL